MRDPESQTPATSPGLQALSRYHGSPWLEPFPVPEIKGSQNQKHAPDTGVSLRNSPERSEGLGTQNRKCPARPGPPPPGLYLTMAHQGWSLSLYPTETGQCFPHTLQTRGSQLRNLRGRMEKWETQNPTQPLRGLCNKPKNPRRHMPES